MDLGGTNVKAGLVKDGQVTARRILKAHSEAGLIKNIPYIERAVDEMLEENGNELDSIEGIGISLPGIVDFKGKRLLAINKKYADAVHFDFNEWVHKKWGSIATLENDARAALIGEWHYGAGKGCDNLIMVTLGTGVGSSVIIEGKVLRGKHYQAGCLGGHFTLNINGKICSCGNVGCMESEASSNVIADMARDNPGFRQSLLSTQDDIDYRTIFRFARDGDSLAIELLQHSLKVWSAGIVNLVHAYDPERIILEGGVLESSADILPYIRDYIDKYAWTPWGKPELVRAANINWAAVLGMYHLVKETI